MKNIEIINNSDIFKDSGEKVSEILASQNWRNAFFRWRKRIGYIYTCKW